MRSCRIFILLPLLWGAFDARAMSPQEVSGMPEQWQLTMEVIKAKERRLVDKNKELQVEYQQLTQQGQKLQQSIDEQQNKNDRMERFLKDRHGRTDQQLRIEELTRGIKTKKREVRALDEQWEKLKKKQAENREAPRAQNTAPSQFDDISRWRKQLEDETGQETILENELMGILKDRVAQWERRVNAVKGQSTAKF